jgi:putative IMPACT (imprinted ancient) family translation regulator
MKLMTVFCLIMFASCAHQRGPASVNGQPVAYDSMALGNVKASAVKRIEKQNVCFDIQLSLKNVKQNQAQASNWTLAWVDKKDQYHLLPVTQRDPASAPTGGAVVAPYGFHHEYSNSFTTCAPNAGMSDVKALVLTPKELPYKEQELKLSWQD